MAEKEVVPDLASLVADIDRDSGPAFHRRYSGVNHVPRPFLAGFVAATRSSLQDPTVPLLLAGLAGYAWTWAIGVLDNLTKMFTVGERTTTAPS